jgi:hypothetical protein
LEKRGIKRLSKLQAQESMNSLKKRDKVSQLEKDTKSAHPKMPQLQDNTKSSQESLKDPSTPSMKEEKEKLSKLQAQESMNSRRKEHTDSLLVKDLKNEVQSSYLALVNMNTSFEMVMVGGLLERKGKSQLNRPPAQVIMMQKVFRKMRELHFSDTQKLKKDLKLSQMNLNQDPVSTDTTSLKVSQKDSQSERDSRSKRKTIFPDQANTEG